MHVFHVNNPQALRIPGRHLYNKCMQGDSLFNMMKHLEHSPTLRPPAAFCCVFPKNQFTVFPDLLPQPDLISAVLFVREME